jgi:hypothetical protein
MTSFTPNLSAQFTVGAYEQLIALAIVVVDSLRHRALVGAWRQPDIEGVH